MTAYVILDVGSSAIDQHRPMAVQDDYFEVWSRKRALKVRRTHAVLDWHIAEHERVAARMYCDKIQTMV